MRRAFCWVFFCAGWLSLATLSAQDTLVLGLRIPTGRLAFATTDALGQVYTLGTDNSIAKYDQRGALFMRYSHNRLGRAAHLDAANPLKLLVWYPDFQTILFLDRTLSPLGQLDVAAAGYFSSTALCTAADGHVWLYDEALQQLVKITPEGKRVAESQRLSQMQPYTLRLSHLYDDGRFVWALGQRAAESDTIHRIVAQFDAYGQWLGIRWQTTDPQVHLLWADAQGVTWQHERWLQRQAWQVETTHRWYLPDLGTPNAIYLYRNQALGMNGEFIAQFRIFGN